MGLTATAASWRQPKVTKPDRDKQSGLACVNSDRFAQLLSQIAKGMTRPPMVDPAVLK